MKTKKQKRNEAIQKMDFKIATPKLKVVTPAEAVETKPVSAPAETKTKYPAEWYEIATRVMDVLNASFSKRDFIKFSLQSYQSLPFKEFGTFFDEWVKEMETGGKIKIHPALTYDYETFSKTNFVPAAPKDE